MIIVKPQKTNTFIPTTVIKSGEVNTNFDNTFEVYGSDDFLFKGWFPLEGASLAFHSSSSFQTTTDINLTSQLQVGDKITWEHATTTGDRFGYITAINYSGTVPNRTWMAIATTSAVLNQALLTDSVGFSRAVNPFGYNLRALEAYPVGSIYININNTNPGTFFGGTWVAFGAGRTLVGVDTGQTEFDTVEETGGAKTHTLSVGEMPSHTHTQNAHNHGLDGGILIGSGTGSNLNTGLGAGAAYTKVGQLDDRTPSVSGTGSTTATNQNTGGGGAHNNLQPYITVYFWKRTA